MSIFSSYKKIFLLGFIIVILIAIPFSVYVAQKRQNITSKATAATTVSFDPVLATVKAGDIVTLNIVLDPGTGATANQISFVKLAINFDPTKFTTADVTDSLAPNISGGNALREPIDAPQYDNTAGKATMSLSIGANPADAIKTKTKIAVLKLKATAATAPTNPNITFDFGNMQVLSIDSGSQTSDNVLLSTTVPATVTVTSTAIASSPTSTPTSTPTVIAAPPTANLGGGLPPPSSPAPVCSSLDINGPTSGIAPYSLTFTATGNAPSGTVTKISFNFGDSVEDLTGGGGIGTGSVSGQLSHTYNMPGTYTAYVILTDSNNNLSDQQAGCTKIITVSSSSVQQPLPPTGDGKIIFGLGTLGIVITIIGGALLLL